MSCANSATTRVWRIPTEVGRTTDDKHDTLAHLAAGALGLPAPGCPDCNGTFTRREHLTHEVIMAGAAASLAIETVSSTSSKNPEWDMEELLTTSEWAAR